MTVKELRKKLSAFDDKTDVYVYWEDGSEQQFFAIREVSISKGEPVRIDGKAGFRFDSKGPASWLFLGIDPA